MADDTLETNAAGQRRLSSAQVEAFYHDHFVEDQAEHFVALVGPTRQDRVVADIGGGCGFFAQRLKALVGARVRVLDSDAESISACRAAGVEAERGDALAPRIHGDEEVVAFNLILHHLVAATDAQTRQLQSRALAAWRAQARAIFVNEYIYESFFGRLSGWLIFRITGSPVLSALGRAVSRFVPSLHANTFGVGVRFRAHREWCELFEAAGFNVQATRIGPAEPISLPRRVLMIKTIRRDSFLLTSRTSQ